MTSADLHSQGAMPSVLTFVELHPRGRSPHHQKPDARPLNTQTYQTPRNPTTFKPQGRAHVHLSSQRWHNDRCSLQLAWFYAHQCSPLLRSIRWGALLAIRPARNGKGSLPRMISYGRYQPYSHTTPTTTAEMRTSHPKAHYPPCNPNTSRYAHPTLPIVPRSLGAEAYNPFRCYVPTTLRTT